MGRLGILVLTLLPLSASVSAIPSRSSILSKVPFPSLTDYKDRINGLWRRNRGEGSVRRATNTSDPDSANLWVVDTLYEGQDFFDGFDFYTDKDPTNGQVQYVDRDTAFGENLTYVTSDNKIIMKVDNTTWLSQGQNRKSVRIQSKKRFNGGLFILDLEKAPHGCGTWPAFWTVGPNWPHGGEIDIFEGVHENTRNQATFHTADGCTITNPQNFTGNLLSSDCSAYADNNAGCGLINDSAASFGAPFNAVGGGVFASRWDSNGVWIWFFHRYTIPNDITNKVPNPELWGKPTALLSNTSCPPNKYFWDHQIVFDITFCGDWAGASYSGDGCPGTCSDHVLDPNNFYNTTWSINYVHVFRNSHVSGSVSAAVPRISPVAGVFGNGQEMACKNAETLRARNVVLVLSALAAQNHALSLPFPRSPSNMYLSKPFSAIKRAFTAGRRQSSSPTSNSNDTANLWVVDSLYEGQNFYDQWDFFNYADPTNGMVEYVDRETAFRERLAYVTPDNKIVMKVDNTTVLQAGQYRKSVRIQSKKRYNGGLFIIDIEKAPHACSAWPAFWTVGPNWPHGGEIDIFEGVHENTKNQATFHTSSGCKITSPQNFTGNLVSDDCSHDYGGMGCGLINDSVASFGAPFNAVGGGVFATRWDDDGVWGWFFHRSTIPRDITSNAPNPKNWGKPTVLLSPSSCPPKKYFWDHVIVFDITLCGDLGGPTYGTSGCPGTCAEQVMNPSVFYNASWSVNYVHVFRNSKVLGSVPSSAHPTSHPLDTTFLFWIALFACWVWRSFRTALMN